jgi:hypothetical protein
MQANSKKQKINRGYGRNFCSNSNALEAVAKKLKELKHQ